MVIDYDSVNMSFQKHGNRLQCVIIDYISETMKSMSHGNRLHYVIIDYNSVKSVSSKKTCNRLHNHVISDASVLFLNTAIV